MNLILFGLKGCGKTYYGKRVAKQLSCPFIDTDMWIENTFQEEQKRTLSCSHIFKQIGEKPFRLLEQQVLRSLEGVKQSVIAVGGGSMLIQKNIDFLKSIGKLIYLKAKKETLKQRVLTSNPFPSFLDLTHPNHSFDQMYASRISLYESIPATWVWTQDKQEKALVQEICSILDE